MTEELVQFQFPKSSSSIIKVIGVGGGGGNAVSHMCEEGIRGVDYIICNTDAQALETNIVPVKIQLGITLTEGRGAGNQPEMGEEAAHESYEDLKKVLKDNTKMLFITAGMGGGTGTGATPVIAKLARELDILTIAVVTIPAPAEGRKRYSQAMEGIEKLKKYVDSMLVISNQRLHNIYGDLPARQAFKMADNIVSTAVKGVAEIITVHGNVNIDYADVKTVMQKSDVFIMGTGYAAGEGRAMQAVNMALESPLLDSNDIYGTKNILLNIISGTQEVRIGEIGEIIETLQKRAGQEADIIWGNGYDESLGDTISVTILATGFVTNPNKIFQPRKELERIDLQEQLFDEDQPEPVTSEVDDLADDDREPIFEFNSKEKIQEQGKKPQERISLIKSPKREDRKKTKTTEPVSDNDDNWFFKKFGLSRLFDEEDDQSM